MKKTKRWLSVCLTVLLLALLISPASASLVEDSDLSLTPMEMNELMAQTAIQTYFTQRESFLKGKTTELPIGYAPLVRDEAKHLEAIQSSGYILVSSTVTVDNADCWDHAAQVAATETVVYQINGIPQTFTVSHLIMVYVTGIGTYEVTSDGYLDSAVNFTSCSYVPSDMISMNTLSSGSSGLCITDVALQEVGEAEDSSENTKYHSYFNYSNGESWCAVFVAWCANQANVSTNVIPKTSSVNSMKSYMQDASCYYPSKSQDPNSTFTPQVGDLFFLYNPTPDEWKNHIGFVIAVEGNYIRVVDGNWDNKVCNRLISITDSVLIGFGRPQYTSSGHSYPLIWQHNSTNHWRYCQNCSHLDTHGHTFRQATPTSPNVCTVCGYSTSIGGGVIMSLRKVTR